MGLTGYLLARTTLRPVGRAWSAATVRGVRRRVLLRFPARVDHDLRAMPVLFFREDDHSREDIVVQKPFELAQSLIDESSKWSGDLHMAASDINAHESVSTVTSSSFQPFSYLVTGDWQLATQKRTFR
jgi:hypothetical protein